MNPTANLSTGVNSPLPIPLSENLTCENDGDHPRQTESITSLRTDTLEQILLTCTRGTSTQHTIQEEEEDWTENKEITTMWKVYRHVEQLYEYIRDELSNSIYPIMDQMTVYDLLYFLYPEQAELYQQFL